MVKDMDFKEPREALVKQLESYLAGDGNLWGRMASSHPEAKGLSPSFIEFAKHLQSIGMNSDNIADYIYGLPTDIDDFYK